MRPSVLSLDPNGITMFHNWFTVHLQFGNCEEDQFSWDPGYNVLTPEQISPSPRGPLTLCGVYTLAFYRVHTPILFSHSLTLTFNLYLSS